MEQTTIENQDTTTTRDTPTFLKRPLAGLDEATSGLAIIEEIADSTLNYINQPTDDSFMALYERLQPRNEWLRTRLKRSSMTIESVAVTDVELRLMRVVATAWTLCTIVAGKIALTPEQRRATPSHEIAAMRSAQAWVAEKRASGEGLIALPTLDTLDFSLSAIETMVSLAEAVLSDVTDKDGLDALVRYINPYLYVLQANEHRSAAHIFTTDIRYMGLSLAMVLRDHLMAATQSGSDYVQNMAIIAAVLQGMETKIKHKHETGEGAKSLDKQVLSALDEQQNRVAPQARGGTSHPPRNDCGKSGHYRN